MVITDRRPRRPVGLVPVLKIPERPSRTRTLRVASRMTSELPEAQTEPTEATRRRATWSGLLLEGQQELRETLPLDEEGFLRVAGPSHADRRAFYIYAVLDEVLKASASILRWLDLLKNMEEPEAMVDRFWTESIADEQSLRIRKLVEVLIDLICFQRTNDDPFYRHFLLLIRLVSVRGTQEDLDLFYACPSENVAAQVKDLASQAAELERSGAVDVGAAWYLTGVSTARTAEDLASMWPGSHIASTRARLRAALPHAEPHERLALGVSYDRLFSRVSRDVHFTPGARTSPRDTRAVSDGLDECGLLGLNVLLAAQRVLSGAGGPVCEQVTRILAENDYPGKLAERVTQGTAEVGDFVLACGDLAEVLDVAESTFGYRSYRVLFLDGSPLPDIPEDWVPAESVRVLFSRRALLERVEQLVADGRVPAFLGARLTSDLEADAFRDALGELWNRGLREVVMTGNR